ncbi:TonB-dependent receptor [Aliiglaciecola sp. 3_MG-2023]|uniref:TonB-dependent receptor domain-containing protein n=1 Tax=Aliiglaciecola sp. 3_MG-2023 TaxID=3062644 RepID=UPI0026E3D3ED|nr:TonB-dependent receptor [Aliiglaciecola sp. 3_MG-2023]MDO6692233.1 TonB-dependent receptor [Aliiglaciecola sp. 3_MG-2023]
MFKLRKISESMVIAFSGYLIASSYAFAQEEQSKDVERISVVGSNIKGSTMTSVLPITELNAEDIATTGALTGDELLRSIPQIGAVGFTGTRGGDTGTNAARGDIGSVNLRSIGEGNTLVLLNGRRMVNHPITQTNFGVPVTSVNSNTLPVSGLARVEVLRDGAGALYGADAVAGVVNYVTKTDFEGANLNVRFGAEQGTNRNDFTISGNKGIEFNDGKSFLMISANYDKKKGVMASENDFSSNQDLRSRAPEEFADDTDFDNRSSLEPWADLHFIGLDSSIDDYIIRPVNYLSDSGNQVDATSCGGGALASGAGVLGDVCLEAAGSHDRALRPNRNEERTLVPDIDRLNLYVNFSHQLTEELEFYNESTYYSSKTERQWEQSAILSNGTFDVPADSYWNPFGPVTFADGRVNPNRIAGLDTGIVPEEGLAYNLIIRPTDVGPRQIEVKSTSFRFLNGLRGTYNNWDWDSGLLYSEAKTDDNMSNRISSPLLLAQLSLDTPDAYNPFTGVNPNDPASIIDLSPNPQSSIDPFLTTAQRSATTKLTLVDFKASNPFIFELPGGDAGIAFGFEWRKEELVEDNSDNFDGSTPFVEGNANPVNGSSLQGSSIRLDVSGERKVFSAFGELALPLLADLPGVYNLDMQLAVRYEDFSDIGNITRPKLALSWFPVESFQVRAAASKGFRAPNLIQLNSPGATLTTSVDDFAENSLDENGEVVVNTTTLSDGGPGNGNYNLSTAGNTELKPEKSENISLGFTLQPLDGLTLTYDWWEVETTDTVGVLSDENISRLDLIARANGSSNPDVIRGEVDEDNPLGEIVQINRRYENLNTRTITGYDISANYVLNTTSGRFEAMLNGARTLKFDQAAGGDALTIVNAGASEDVLGSDVGDIVGTSSIPEWQATASLKWKSTDDLWGAGVFVKYVGDVLNTSVSKVVDSNTIFYNMPSQTRVNLSVTRNDFLGYDGLRFTLGVNNLADKEPPLADTAFGYDGSLHSSRGRYFYTSANYSF